MTNTDQRDARRHRILAGLFAACALFLAGQVHANVQWDSLVWNTDVWAGDNPDDPDVDSVLGIADNCPFDPNPDQANLDMDGLGNVCDPDADGDELVAEQEEMYGTDPLNADTDGDGNPDGAEVAMGRNPTLNEGTVLMTIINAVLDD
ncbi:MAG: hypothetical protein KDI88_08010 [Gammaproteobacteria bacterium]|nr:hypothetical protein [Gammaproteobacteria bacterium]